MPLTSLYCLGLSFRTAPLAVRERAAFEGSRAQGILYAAGLDASVRGVALLSTCGRTELYVDVRDGASGARL